MLPTYRAVLRGGQLEWTDEVPEETVNQPHLDVFVTIIGKPPNCDKQRGSRMASALESIAQKGGVSTITEASEWQRDLREERPLPGRAE